MIFDIGLLIMSICLLYWIYQLRKDLSDINKLCYIVVVGFFVFIMIWGVVLFVIAIVKNIGFIAIFGSLVLFLNGYLALAWYLKEQGFIICKVKDLRDIINKDKK